MKDNKVYLYSKQNQSMQISYSEYLFLTEQVAETQRLQALKDAVMADLQRVLEGVSAVNPVAMATAAVPIKKSAPEVLVEAPKVEKKVEKVSVELPAASPVSELKEKADGSRVQKKTPSVDIPPIKKDIAEHFNKLDSSGRLLNVFTQYYTCLNELCGGTVRVTIKDGFCSLWNYDEWEEFAFIDIFEGHLRIAVDPSYTDKLSSLNFCEVPRLLSSRRELICLQIDDLNKLVLDVLTQAFSEVGTRA